MCFGYGYESSCAKYNPFRDEVNFMPQSNYSHSRARLGKNTFRTWTKLNYSDVWRSNDWRWSNGYAYIDSWKLWRSCEFRTLLQQFLVSNFFLPLLKKVRILKIKAFYTLVFSISMYSTATLNRKAYIFGGLDGFKQLDIIACFDGSEWNQVGRLLAGMFSLLIPKKKQNFSSPCA